MAIFPILKSPTDTSRRYEYYKAMLDNMSLKKEDRTRYRGEDNEHEFTFFSFHIDQNGMSTETEFDFASLEVEKFSVPFDCTLRVKNENTLNTSGYEFTETSIALSPATGPIMSWAKTQPSYYYLLDNFLFSNVEIDALEIRGYISDNPLSLGPVRDFYSINITSVRRIHDDATSPIKDFIAYDGLTYGDHLTDPDPSRSWGIEDWYAAVAFNLGWDSEDRDELDELYVEDELLEDLNTWLLSMAFLLFMDGVLAIHFPEGTYIGTVMQDDPTSTDPLPELRLDMSCACNELGNSNNKFEGVFLTPDLKWISTFWEHYSLATQARDEWWDPITSNIEELNGHPIQSLLRAHNYLNTIEILETDIEFATQEPVIADSYNKGGILNFPYDETLENPYLCLDQMPPTLVLQSKLTADESASFTSLGIDKDAHINTVSDEYLSFDIGLSYGQSTLLLTNNEGQTLYVEITDGSSDFQLIDETGSEVSDYTTSDSDLRITVQCNSTGEKSGSIVLKLTDSDGPVLKEISLASVPPKFIRLRFTDILAQNEAGDIFQGGYEDIDDLVTGLNYFAGKQLNYFFYAGETTSPISTSETDYQVTSSVSDNYKKFKFLSRIENPLNVHDSRNEFLWLFEENERDYHLNIILVDKLGKANNDDPDKLTATSLNGLTKIPESLDPEDLFYLIFITATDGDIFFRSQILYHEVLHVLSYDFLGKDHAELNYFDHPERGTFSSSEPAIFSNVVEGYRIMYQPNNIMYPSNENGLQDKLKAYLSYRQRRLLWDNYKTMDV